MNDLKPQSQPAGSFKDDVEDGVRDVVKPLFAITNQAVGVVKSDLDGFKNDISGSISKIEKDVEKLAGDLSADMKKLQSDAHGIFESAPDFSKIASSIKNLETSVLSSWDSNKGSQFRSEFSAFLSHFKTKAAPIFNFLKMDSSSLNGLDFTISILDDIDASLLAPVANLFSKHIDTSDLLHKLETAFQILQQFEPRSDGYYVKRNTGSEESALLAFSILVTALDFIKNALMYISSCLPITFQFGVQAGESVVEEVEASATVKTLNITNLVLGFPIAILKCLVTGLSAFEPYMLDSDIS